MQEPGPLFWEVFFDVYEALPRQGPGNRASAERALGMCRDLPAAPDVLDLGCGTGAQTLYLAELTGGSILAIDSHEPAIERLAAQVRESGLADRVQAAVGDMASPGVDRSFDLIWSEGALYNIGIAPALQVCSGLLRPGGYLVFTDAVWLRDDPPREVADAFELDYPAMGTVEDILALIKASGVALVDHFTLPDQAWWDDFYLPMERRVEELKPKYDGDPEARAALAEVAREPEMHRRFGDYYAYEFFVTRRRSR